MFCSSCAFSSSSGSRSKKIPKSCRFKFATSAKVLTLNVDIEFFKASAVKGKFNTSTIFLEMFSHNLNVKYKLALLMCLVAIFDCCAAIFCKPTNVSLSGSVPSLASFKPVTSRIICT